MHGHALALIGALAAATALAEQPDALDAFKALSSAIGAATVCSIHSAGQPGEARAVIWSPRGDGPAGAVIWRATTSAGTRDPCWSGAGHCAVIEQPPIEAQACAEAVANDPHGAFTRRAVSGVHSTSTAETLPDEIAAFAHQAVQIAEGLEGDEHTVRLVDGHAVHLAGGHGEPTRARVALPAGDIRIEHLRAHARSLDPQGLEAAAKALNTRTLRGAGPHGALARVDDGTYRLTLGTTCMRVVTPQEMRKRIERAEGELTLGRGPEAGLAPEEELERLAQELLGGTGRAHERAQSAAIFLAAPKNERACEGGGG